MNKILRQMPCKRNIPSQYRTNLSNDTCTCRNGGSKSIKIPHIYYTYRNFSMFVPQQTWKLRKGMFAVIDRVDEVIWPPSKDLSADVLSARPSSGQINFDLPSESDLL